MRRPSAAAFLASRCNSSAWWGCRGSLTYDPVVDAAAAAAVFFFAAVFTPAVVCCSPTPLSSSSFNCVPVIRRALQAKPEFNGRQGTVRDKQPKPGRVAVRATSLPPFFSPPGTHTHTQQSTRLPTPSRPYAPEPFFAAYASVFRERARRRPRVSCPPIQPSVLHPCSLSQARTANRHAHTGHCGCSHRGCRRLRCCSTARPSRCPSAQTTWRKLGRAQTKPQGCRAGTVTTLSETAEPARVCAERGPKV